MTIHELAERSGVPARRIRYYVSRGLLPPPSGRGPTARYTSDHLERLRRIRELRAQRLGLEEIRERLEQGSSDTDAATPWYHWPIGPGVVLMVEAGTWQRESAVIRTLVDIARRIRSGSVLEDPR